MPATLRLPNGRAIRHPGAVELSAVERARADAELELRLRSQQRHAAERLSLRAFTAQAWAVVEPGVPYRSNWHIDAISEHLTAISDGEIKDLIISMPPRMLKSRKVCVFWPAWEWAEREPALKWLFASYSHTLSKRDSVDCRRLIQSPWYRSRYGHVFSLVSDQNEKMRYENSRRGVRVATSVGGATTGEGGNRLVIDDPHNVKEVWSETQRQAVIDWHEKAWISRRNDPESDARLVVAQRTHPSDLIGHLLREHGTGPGGWYHLVLPMEYSPKRRVTTLTPLSEDGRFEDPRTEEGELLHPERIGAEENAKLKRSMGAEYDAQYNQDPVPEGGHIVDPTWWRYFRETPAGLEEVILSWDCSFKGEQKRSGPRRRGGSYACGQVWGRRGSQKFLLEQVRRRMGYVETREEIRRMAQRWPHYNAILIEEAANGYAVIEDLRQTIHSILPVRPRESKEARLQAVAPTVKAGDCYLPDPALTGNEWVRDYLKSLAEHPHGVDGNDEGDATSQALNYLRGHDGEFTPIH